MKTNFLTKIIGILTSFALTLSLSVNVMAFTPTVSIEDLPDYTNTDTFDISYSALVDGDVSAVFSVIKDGDSTWRDFGGTITGASGQVQVGGSQIYSGEGLYFFRVVINGGPLSAETSTRIDRSGPSPVSNYSKVKVAGGFYRISWTTPHDSDFSRVFIYRSDKFEFDANGSTKVYELGGPPSTNQSWDNVGLDPNKDYYYAIRAVDKAGNASSLVSDNVTITYITPAPTGSGGVTQLPKEEATDEGSILGEKDETSQTPSAGEGAKGNVFEKITTFARERTKITVGIIAIVLISAYLLYNKFSKKGKQSS